MTRGGSTRSMSTAPEKGKGRWADNYNWIYDFDHVLPAGVRCTFELKPSITALDGQTLASGQRFTFTTAHLQYILLVPGDHHGDEVMAGDGEDWLGLFRNGDVVNLKPVRIKISPFKDIADEDGKETGKSVSVSDGEDSPILLLRCLCPMQLKPGFVKTVSGSERKLERNETIDLSLGNDHQMQLSVAPSESGDHVVILSGGRVKQTLMDFPGPDDLSRRYSLSLVWAGDLDGDGKLDLLFDDIGNNVGLNYRLFLSSAAKANKFVEEVASFMAEGC